MSDTRKAPFGLTPEQQAEILRYGGFRASPLPGSIDLREEFRNARACIARLFHRRPPAGPGPAQP